MNKRTSVFTTTLFIAICAAGLAAAQDESDALRFSQIMPQGTARSMGFGNALGSIGGDFSSITVNPAGIGVYRTSEISFTPSLKLNSTNSTFSGTGSPSTTTDNNTRFTINQLGAVFTNAAKGTRYKKSKWKAASFGIGINRIADFNSNHMYSGYNDSSSASEVFLVDAIRYPDDFENTATFAGLGYQSYLIDYDNNAGYYKVANHNAGLNQSRKVEQRGGITDVNFSFGGNYEEKLFLGATVGIPSVRYNKDVTLREEDASGDLDNDFDNFEYRESLQTRGTGINLKLGFIYNFNKYFRAGAAFHTPTFYGLNDVFNRSVVSNTENFKNALGDFTGPTTRVDAPTNEYAYTLVTPWRGVISAAGIIGKNGFITVDYEYVNYASARYNFDDLDSRYQDEVNNGIKNMYKGASNIRIGGEARFDIVMARLGFGYYGNPYQDATMGSKTLTYSAGVGFRFDNVFLDLGFMHTAKETKEQPYTLAYPQPIGDIWVPSANIKSSFNNVALTVGFKF